MSKFISNPIRLNEALLAFHFVHRKIGNNFKSNMEEEEFYKSVQN